MVLVIGPLGLGEVEVAFSVTLPAEGEVVVPLTPYDEVTVPLPAEGEVVVPLPP